MAQVIDFRITNKSIIFARNQLKAPTVLVFGDRSWEAFLLQQQDKWKNRLSLGHTMLQYLHKLANASGAEYAFRLRSVLTAGFAPLYDFAGRVFPFLCEDDLEVVRISYPATDPEAIDRLQVDVQFSMIMANTNWDSWFLHILRQSKLNPPEKYFVLVALKTAIERVQERMHEAEHMAEMMHEVQQQHQLKAGQEMPDVQPTPPRYTLDDIGGCVQAKNEIVDLIWLLNKPEVAVRWGGQVPRGALLAGPPGNGKTMFVHALASHTGRKLLAESMKDIFIMWLGMSTQRLAHIFKIARETKNVVLFFDEADGLLGSRNASQMHEEYRKVVNEFCVQIEAIQPEENVIVLLASNFKEHLDEAAIRARRIDMIIKVDKPATDAERMQVFAVHVKAAEKVASRALFVPGLDWPRIAKQATGLSGADLAGVIDIALRAKKIQEAQTGNVPGLVTLDELQVAFQKYIEARKAKAHSPIGY